MKRTKAAMEEQLVLDKCKHDMDMEQKRFRLEESVKLAEIEHEDKRLAIELLRETRLAEENKQRSDMFETLKDTLACWKTIVENK